MKLTDPVVFDELRISPDPTRDPLACPRCRQTLRPVELRWRQGVGSLYRVSGPRPGYDCAHCGQRFERRSGLHRWLDAGLRALPLALGAGFFLGTSYLLMGTLPSLPRHLAALREWGWYPAGWLVSGWFLFEVARDFRDALGIALHRGISPLAREPMRGLERVRARRGR